MIYLVIKKVSLFLIYLIFILKNKRLIKEQIASGAAKIIIGTHAVITDDTIFNKCALVITDEQHRFGVRQRMALSGKGENLHSLIMTATPIPRTLSLILYGDLDISIIDELPKGRQKIETLAVGEDKRARVNEFVIKQLNEGRQAYFVCPLIEESEVIEATAAYDYLERLKKGAFKNRKIDVLHGRMKPAEKEEVMSRFVKGELEAIVSTTVVEVGVDVPNTVMVIENAERFGLSQLHQLRGRVGRGQWKSYCIMFCESGSSFARQRMQVMCETDDGFKIAEKDLELRGPGEFLGTRQHGLPEMRIGDLISDMELLKEAQSAARVLLEHDPKLEKESMVALKKCIEKTFDEYDGILN